MKASLTVCGPKTEKEGYWRHISIKQYPVRIVFWGGMYQTTHLYSGIIQYDDPIFIRGVADGMDGSPTWTLFLNELDSNALIFLRSINCPQVVIDNALCSEYSILYSMFNAEITYGVLDLITLITDMKGNCAITSGPSFDLLISNAQVEDLVLFDTYLKYCSDYLIDHVLVRPDTLYEGLIEYSKEANAEPLESKNLSVKALQRFYHECRKSVKENHEDVSLL